VFLSAPTSNNSTATQVRNTANQQTVSGFGYMNTSVTKLQTGGAVPTERNGQIAGRIQWWGFRSAR